MGDAKNLDLDVDRTGRGKSSAEVLRICVVEAFAFTRHGGAPTISADCRSVAALEREVERLKAELDAALERARERAGGAAGAGAAPQTPSGTERPAAPAPAPRVHLDTTLRVADVMTRDVRTVGPNDPLSLADELMQVGRFRHIVVLDGDRVVGVISQRDIFYGALAWSLGQGRTAQQKALESTRAKDVMQTDVVATAPGASLAEAAAQMRERKLGCLPVQDGEALVGILTEGDFLALLSVR
jgi:CBS domain-containing protein